ncbi:BglG family transcription antiterminator [Enterococcus sp. BWT-B8]|uniref:BglG family transcription antiterminator n=1 Tax=Enterococcus sp. BWT-B8 TaxID=2885157 RepID=UPI001E446A91|nr:BglG family transcription antiterminator [Enterococcus sp. BWT-B8]MCB5950479.1 BglG family transcription antiterminator [Enterococcus sp. BWT-B8]
MDSMMKRIIEMILNTPGVASQYLKDELHVNKSQLDYRIKKINDCLEEMGFQKVEKRNHRYFLSVSAAQRRQLLTSGSSLIHLQGHERQIYIILLVILYKNLTLGMLAEKLSVSRNTILSDIKTVEPFLAARQLGIRSKRAKGYFLTGEEIAVRKLWLYLVKEEIEKDFELKFFYELLSIDRDKLHRIDQRISLMEKELQLYFSEVKISYLRMIVYLSLVRFSNKEEVTARDIAGYGDLLNQEIFHVVEQHFSSLYSESSVQPYDQELRFIIMHVLSINIVKRTSFKQSPELLKAIKHSINYFEKSSITFFENKQELCDVLYQHIIPASYRIRFGVPDEGDLSQSIRQEYREFYFIVKKAVCPVERILGIEFVEEELSYILIIFLSFLKGEKITEEKQKTAVVVCMHGVSVSRLLLENLKELLPDILFKRYMSLREFYELNPQVDIVFSTVGVDTDIPTFFIKHFLTDHEKRTLKRKVEGTIFSRYSYSEGIDSLNLDGLLQVIEKYADIRAKGQLKQELEQFLLPDNDNEEITGSLVFKDDYSLLELLPRQNIQIYDKALNFNEAIRLSAKPLLQNGSIETGYVEKILEGYNPEYPYFVIAPEVAIPHDGPENGVNKLGMSFLRVREPIPFSKELSVRIIVMIAPKDKKTHLNAVTTLYNLVNNEAFRSALLTAPYEQDIYDLFFNELTENNKGQTKQKIYE